MNGVARPGVGETAVRFALGAAGIAAIGFGLLAARDIEFAKLVSAAVWLAGVVVAHDFVLSPFVVVLGVLALRWVPGAWRVPLVVGFVLWGSLTLIALPALSGLGVRPDSPSLLDRPYRTTWLIGTALVVLAVLVAGALRRKRD